MCGEQTNEGPSDDEATGSPPRVRGTVSPGTGMSGSRGITPACAGNRKLRSKMAGSRKDHPRVCGEQACAAASSREARGSPPRVRGTAEQSCFYGVNHRITPACAGNRPPINEPWADQQDHPRVCGEQKSLPTVAASRLGSPPRVRGTAPSTSPSPSAQRITPACAGNRQQLINSKAGRWDHPRVCGEQHYRAWQGGFALGSPPRVRGTVAFPGLQPSEYRITPACAGNRALGHERSPAQQDHPRVCGEQARLVPSLP